MQGNIKIVKHRHKKYLPTESRDIEKAKLMLSCTIHCRADQPSRTHQVSQHYPRSVAVASCIQFREIRPPPSEARERDEAGQNTDLLEILLTQWKISNTPDFIRRAVICAR